MRRTSLNDPTASALMRHVVELERRLKRVEEGQGASQLGNSSIENGNLTVYDANGQVRQTIGKLPDGTFGLGSANGLPPPRPNTPELIVGKAGLTVRWNGQFTAARPGDLSHVNINLSPVGPDFINDPSNNVGSFQRAGDFPVGPLPYVEHWARLTAVNTSNQESESSFTVGPVTPSRLLGSDLFPNIITETEIADDSISTPKLQANAVTALNILAEAIKAYHLDAGIVTAEKLAATLILVSKIILGDPIAARLEIESSGITQFSTDGDPTLRIGKDPQGGNYFTVVDPNNAQRALASISDGGVISAQDFSVAGDFMYQGNLFNELLADLPMGVVVIGSTTTSSNTTTGEIGWFEMEFIARAGRMYKFTGSPVQAEVIDGTAVADRMGMVLRHTTNGSRPTTTSSPLSVSALTNLSVGTLSAVINSFSSDTRIRLLITIASYAEGKSVRSIASSSAPTRFIVEDIGRQAQYNGGLVNGSGSDTTPSTKRTTTWNCTWCRSFRGDGSVRFSNGEMVQGYYSGASSHGDQHSAFGFDDSNIRSTLSGATINGARLYIYAHHWYYSTGGFARIRTHNSGATNSYPGVSASRWTPKIAKPGGVWVDIGSTVGNEFKNNNTKGFALDARDVARSLHDYGRFDGIGWSRPPKLEITYTK